MELRRTVFATVILAVIGSLLWGFWLEPASLRVEEVTLPLAWPYPRPLRVAVVSDLHVGSPYQSVGHLREVVDRINTKLDDGAAMGVGIGVATGTALATNMGSANCSDYTMVGDSINIASRLQGKAATGEILVTAEAYKSISAVFPDAIRVEYLLKGISHPVVAHRLFRGPSAMT